MANGDRVGQCCIKSFASKLGHCIALTLFFTYATKLTSLIEKIGNKAKQSLVELTPGPLKETRQTWKQVQVARLRENSMIVMERNL